VSDADLLGAISNRQLRGIGQKLGDSALPSVVVNPSPFVGCGNLAPPVTGTFNTIDFSVVTDGDDLRGDSTATLTVNINGSPTQFTLKSQSDPSWGQGSTNVKIFRTGDLPVGAFGDFTISLQSHNGFMESDDNWNIGNITAKLIDSKTAASTCYVRVSGSPYFVRLSGSQSTSSVRAFTGC
jgi:hypothetical protein